MDIIKPLNDFTVHHDSSRVPLEFLSSPQGFNGIEGLHFKLAIFKTDDYYILIKDLANILNYPSSYQLMAKIIKQSSLTKQDFLKTDIKLNQSLGDLIDNPSQSYFYIKLSLMYGILANKSILTHAPQEQPPKYQDIINDDKVTISQIFPQYGFIDATLELNHATFNSLTNLTKYNYYKAIGDFRHAPITKMFDNELEVFYALNDHAKIKLHDNEINEQIKKRKPLGKNKKTNASDPNTMDLTENVIPGQGFIQEFNVNQVCKVPNYYIISQQQQQQQAQYQQNLPPQPVSTSGTNTPNGSTSSLVTKKDKVSRNVQSLIFNNDNDHLTYNKYFYAKTYRGLGSGNYKDASIMNRINRVPIINNPSVENNRIVKLHKKNIKYNKRYNLQLKGLIHEKINKNYLDFIIQQQRKNVEDYDNIEMLHNVLQFNLLMNTYRDISFNTWKNYYKFKLTDFNQILNKDLDLSKNYLLSRFNLPHEYKEINRHLDLEFRDQIKKPLYYNLKLPTPNNPQVLSNVEIIKLPNANESGWDNLKKYRDD